MKLFYATSLGLLLTLQACPDVFAQPSEGGRTQRLLDDRTPPQNRRSGRWAGRGGGDRGSNRSPLPKVGQQFPRVTAYTESGEDVQLPEHVGGNYTVLVRGCLTCPVFWRSYHHIEAVARDYAPLGVKFHFVYGSLAHPENNSYIQPFSLEERLMHVKEAKRTLKTTVPWLADSMDNRVKWAMGNFPNSEVLLDSDGKVIYFQSWSNASELRRVLKEHVGPSKTHTDARDLNLPTIRRTRSTGEVLPRVQVKSQLTPVKIRAVSSGEPHYAKLRVEVEPSVLVSGAGQVYLGFHLDPLYGTHWNNLADPLRYELKVSEGVQVTPQEGTAPEVAEVADTGPREFLVDLQGAASGVELELTTYYYACSHDPDFCKAIAQKYIIELTRDPFGGGVAGRSFRFGGGRSRGPRGGR